MSLKGTTALITGASSGIGEATALAFGAAGMNVAIAARRKDRLDNLAVLLRACGVEALVLEADITDTAQPAAIVERTVERFGRLDALINNAGVMLLGAIPGADPGEWHRMVDLNFTALTLCTLAALPHLQRAAQSEPRRVADIVNVSSVAGRVARANAGVYNATKFAVGAYSEALRQEVTRQHVRVALVEPGAVTTELGSHNRPEVREAMAKRLAGVERLDPKDVADAILYVVGRPRHMAVNEMLIRPTEQEG